MSFFIKEIIVTGEGKTTSKLEFKKGLNIIYGPSNTGKTYVLKCVDYLFGSDKKPFDESTGYQYIIMNLETELGSLQLKRKLDSKKIEIISYDKRIPSGNYNIKVDRKNYEKTINHVWLTLIGINEMHLINKNMDFKKQLLSWRTFSHMFILNEARVISEKSVLLPEYVTSNTASISSLIFLITGNDFSEINSKESKEIKAVRKKAITQYINQELFMISERNQQLLNEIQEESITNINEEINIIISKISEQNNKLNNAIKNNQKLLSQIYSKNENLSEYNVLINRYSNLNSQYNADLKRLNFIVDGEINFDKNYFTNCPFCENKLSIDNKIDYIDAAKTEFKKIKLQIKDLTDATGALIKEKKKLEQEILDLLNRKKHTEEMIELEIKPELSNLKNKLELYKKYIENKKELDLLEKIVAQKKIDIIKTDISSEDQRKFIAKDYLNYSFINEFSEQIKNYLEKCKYENLSSVYFDKNDMDIVINGKPKKINGKGYNAYLNSVIEIVLANYMNENAVYPPNFLMIDSPILSLKENLSKKPSETIKNALFENLVETSKNMQIIIIENEIPNINYHETNLIEFTQDSNNGRYGFLLDIKNNS